MDRVTDGLRSWGVVMIPWPEQGWRGLTSRQRRGVVLRGMVQIGLLVVAVRDLVRRPAGQVRGAKWLWAPVIAVNYLGLGPIVYLLGGRRRR
ncbi:MAG TPA: hypothetical protein VK875_01215 [Euzebyales bacterium]|nr:hypothetical protein [Euzebyales bacterium]